MMVVLDKALMGSAPRQQTPEPETATQGVTHVTEPLSLAATKVAHWNNYTSLQTSVH
jgi:hypothetical protein